MILTVTNGKKYLRFKELVNGQGSPPYFNPVPVYENYVTAGTT
jgi:hypothetical protein